MDMNLKNQTAVIVGAARGIGYAIAREFAREGAGVALVDRENTVTDAAAGLAREFRVPASAAIAASSCVCICCICCWISGGIGGDGVGEALGVPAHGPDLIPVCAVLYGFVTGTAIGTNPSRYIHV